MSDRRQMKLNELSDNVASVSESANNICPTCGENFVSDLGVKIHHKQVHDESLKPSVNCEYCGDEFRIKPRRKDTAQFCSEKCQENFYDENHRTRLECEYCGYEYTVKAAEADSSRWCSRDCQTDALGEANSGPDSPRWSGGEATVTCDYCGDEYTVRQAKVDETRFCSLSCKGDAYAEERRGSDHPGWKGGHRQLAATLRSLTGPNSWDRMSEEHRSDRCYLCGCLGENNDHAHHVHHIIPVLAGGLSEEWNLMTLCSSCHRTVESYTTNYIQDQLLLDIDSKQS